MSNQSLQSHLDTLEDYIRECNLHFDLYTFSQHPTVRMVANLLKQLFASIRQTRVFSPHHHVLARELNEVFTALHVPLWFGSSHLAALSTSPLALEHVVKRIASLVRCVIGPARAGLAGWRPDEVKREPFEFDLTELDDPAPEALMPLFHLLSQSGVSVEEFWPMVEARRNAKKTQAAQTLLHKAEQEYSAEAEDRLDTEWSGQEAKVAELEHKLRVKYRSRACGSQLWHMQQLKTLLVERRLDTSLADQGIDLLKDGSPTLPVEELIGKITTIYRCIESTLQSHSSAKEAEMKRLQDAIEELQLVFDETEEEGDEEGEEVGAEEGEEVDEEKEEEEAEKERLALKIVGQMEHIAQQLAEVVRRQGGQPVS